MNDYLARQAAKERAIASVAEDMTRQFCLDVLCITMNEEFGFGVGRLDRLTTALSANYNKYHPALEGGQEHEVWQERIDAAHRRILRGKRELIPFARRYPELIRHDITKPLRKKHR